MDNKPTIEIKAAGYENIYYDCPHCGFENIVNRATDLSPMATTSGMDVSCQDCKKILWLKGDRIQAATYKWFLQELPVLKEKKLYRDYALTLCQGAENFFLQAIINKNFDRSSTYRTDEGRIKMHEYIIALEQYKQSIKAYTFYKMRKLFLDTYDDERLNPTERISRLKEDRRAWAFEIVKKSSINTLRNNVAHKNAYRPTLADVETHDGLIYALNWLGMYLNVLNSNFARSENTKL